MVNRISSLVPLLLLFSLLTGNTLFSQGSKVEMAKTDGVWNFMIDGEPFYAKGAGGQEHLDVLVAAGGNTIRTWATDKAQAVLDEAHKRGLKVMMGLWVQHERHGFDYNNEAAVKNQLENFRQEVRKYKDHPALLLWGIGNEYELQYSNTRVWAAVNDIAKMVHEEDPNHPTSTVTAGTNAEKLKFVMEELTEVDVYGINTYGDIGNVRHVLKNGGFTGPYMITEWGPTGHWESPKTKWGVSIEQTSTEKAASYLQRYKDFIEAERAQCVGSFAFLWGQKQEYTSTWYGLFTDTQIPTEAIDVLAYCWSGKYPENRAPTIEAIRVNGEEAEVKNLIVNPAEKIDVEFLVTDPNGDPINYTWELYPESTDKKSGGDKEAKPPAINGRIKGKNASAIALKTPVSEGAYRLFVFADDGEKVAYMNLPFYVMNDPAATPQKVRFKQQTMQSFNEN